MARFIAAYGLYISPGSQPHHTFKAELVRAHGAYCEEVLEYDRSLDDDQFPPALDLTAPTSKIINAAWSIVVVTARTGTSNIKFSVVRDKSS
ncbi:MAG: hypothetical protein JKY27_11365 [Magnetovibrio sp.]|nr:hypothetical protein [Magnetovibrio sp.]